MDENKKLKVRGVLTIGWGFLLEIILICAGVNVVVSIIIGIVIMAIGLLLVAGGFANDKEKQNEKQNEYNRQLNEEKKRIDNAIQDKKQLNTLISDFKIWLENYKNKLKQFNLTISDIDFSKLRYAVENDEYSSDSHRFTRIKDAILIVPGTVIFPFSILMNDMERLELNESHVIDHSSFKLLEAKSYTSIKLLHLDSLLFWEISGEIESRGISSRPSKLNIAMTEAMWGTAAAINKANSPGTTLTWDRRKIIMHFKIDGNITTYEISIKSLDTVRNIFPEKNGEISINAIKHTEATTAAISSADELKKFKDLLDAGIISQEEFDAKKKQLLGL